MSLRFVLGAACMLAVTGCGPAGEQANPAEGNAAGAAGAARAGGAGFAGTMRPGQWEVTSSGDVDGTERLCITAEQVRQSSFVGNSLQGQDQCSVERDRMGGGVIDVRIACGAGRHPMIMRGRYTAESFEIDSSLEVPAGGETQTIQARRTGRWLADACDPEAQDEASEA